MKKITSTGYWGKLRKICQNKMFVSSEYKNKSFEIFKTPNAFTSVSSEALVDGTVITGEKYKQSIAEQVSLLQNTLKTL